MKSYIAMGIFAFLVSMISLLRIMSAQEFHRLTAMKRSWGRTRGLALHFLSNVVLPLVCGLVFLAGGISGVRLVQPLIAENPFQGSFRERPAMIEDNRSTPTLADTYTNLA